MVERDLSSHIPDAQNWQPATIGRRFGALVVDWLLCLLVASLIGDPRRVWWPPLLVLILEYGFFIGLFTQTPGMAVVGIRCVSAADGGRIGVPRAALRGLLLALVIPAIVMDAHQRGWHDRAAGSIITRKP